MEQSDRNWDHCGSAQCLSECACWCRDCRESVKELLEHRPTLETGPLQSVVNKLRAEIVALKLDGEGDARQIHGQSEKIKGLELQVGELHRALGSMLESYGACIGETPNSRAPLPPVALGVVKGYFIGAEQCNSVYHKYADKQAREPVSDICQTLRDDGLHCWLDRPCPVHEKEGERTS